MTATLAVAAADPQPVARLAADRRSLRGNPKDEGAFAALLDETAQDPEPAAKDQPRADDPGRQDVTPLPSPHFLLAAHHAEAARQAVNPELRPVTTKVLEREKVGSNELFVQPRNRSAAKPTRTAEAPDKSALDGIRPDISKLDSPETAPLPPPLIDHSLQPSKQSTNIETMPDTELKPIIIPTTAAARKPDEDRGNAGDHPTAEPTETPAPQATGKPDITPPHQSAPHQPPPTAAQLADRLAPAINQAQAILRILETAGETAPIVKTLQFGLRPRDFGEVRVTLSLGSGELSLRIETQTEEAARRLELDRSLLDTMLTQAGVSIDRTQIDIRAARFDSPQPAASFDGAGPRGGETANAFAEGQSQRQPRPGNSHQTSEGHRHASSANGSTDRRDRRSIYL